MGPVEEDSRSGSERAREELAMTPTGFLSEVWGHSCRDGDIVFLATKDGSGRWKDHPIKYGRNTIAANVAEFLKNNPPSKTNLYFCPTPFTGRRRTKENVRAVNLLWSDLDHAKPRIKPTLLWESSPGRLQALWYLTKETDNRRGEALNRALTYEHGADKGGWDLTQVLRIPGTRNHKYPDKPTVHVLSNTGRKYRVNEIRDQVGGSAGRDGKPAQSSGSYEQVLAKYRRQIPPKVKALLSQRHVEAGHRSEIIWFIENKLSEIGMSPTEIMTVIKHSAWNKYKGRRDEDERLKSEMSKIIENKIHVPAEKDVEKAVEEEASFGLTVESYVDVMQSVDRHPGWLVEGFWLARSHGAIAGEPKSFKSTLALDLGLSVASGKPFLNKYPVKNAGPVMYIQNENARWIMKDRLAKIAHNRGLIGDVKKNGDTFQVKFPDELPFYMVNQQSYLFTDPVHQKITEAMIEEYKPVLVIFDPLYLMFDGDLASARDLSPVLSWLLELRFKFQCGIILIHHWNKGGDGASKRGGQRMLGSTTIHGWVESAWYVSVHESEVDEEEEDVTKARAAARVSVEREFRGAGIHPRVDMSIKMGETGKFTYGVDVEVRKKKGMITEADQEKQVLAIIVTKKYGIDLNDLAKQVGFTREVTTKIVDRITAKGLAKRNGKQVVKI